MSASSALTLKVRVEPTAKRKCIKKKIHEEGRQRLNINIFIRYNFVVLLNQRDPISHDLYMYFLWPLPMCNRISLLFSFISEAF